MVEDQEKASDTMQSRYDTTILFVESTELRIRDTSIQFSIRRSKHYNYVLYHRNCAHS